MISIRLVRHHLLVWRYKVGISWNTGMVMSQLMLWVDLLENRQHLIDSTKIHCREYHQICNVSHRLVVWILLDLRMSSNTMSQGYTLTVQLYLPENGETNVLLGVARIYEYRLTCKGLTVPYKGLVIHKTSKAWMTSS